MLRRVRRPDAGRIGNRPGLPAITYRVGEHGSFLATMKARLSSSEFPGLKGLTARTTDDPSVALLDGWSTVADVLTFYQERLANEGYLRTATERRSVLELARLIGYPPRPGVAASAYLAYTIDENTPGDAEIPAGSRAQSLPDQVSCRNRSRPASRSLARREWNAIKPRLRRPADRREHHRGNGRRRRAPGSTLRVSATNIKANDLLLLTSDSGCKGLLPGPPRSSSTALPTGR